MKVLSSLSTHLIPNNPKDTMFAQILIKTE